MKDEKEAQNVIGSKSGTTTAIVNNDKDTDVITSLENAKRASHATQDKNFLEVLIEAN